MAEGCSPLAPAPDAHETAPARLRIGLVNNMADAALAATERQFARLLGGTPGIAVELSLYSLAGVARGPAAREMMAGRYQGLEALMAANLDGVVVTGAEPRAADLRDEPYWDEMARLADWAAAGRAPSLWSCLAAHAAVLRLDGIARRPLARKLTGVFACETVAPHALTRGLRPGMTTPHSRRNGLAAEDLTAGGYEVLVGSRATGAELFARPGAGPMGAVPMAFLQGHPEYDATSLQAEFRRDLGRCIRGEQDWPPALPRDYFAADVEQTLLALVEDARRAPSPALMSRFDAIVAGRAPVQTWRETAVGLYGAWVGVVAGVG